MAGPVPVLMSDMSVLSEQSIFATMRQNGPFAVEDSILLHSPFSQENRKWVHALRADEVQTSKYRAIRSQIFNLLQVRRFSDIETLLKDADARDSQRTRAHRLLGNLFNIKGESNEVLTKLREFATTADSVIDYLRNKVLATHAAEIEISNEISATNDPVDLLLLIFDDRYHKKVRFEAKRKLVLMNLAGAIDQQERNADIEARFARFIDFLNDHVWSLGMKRGEHRHAYLFSEHSAQDYACQKVQVIDPETASSLAPKPNQRLTLIKRRLFQSGSREIPIYVSVRKKNSAAKVIKLLRKNEKNPVVAVDDELGLMAVLDGRSEVNRFVEHLTDAAARAGVLMTLEDISDTLTGGSYSAQSTGSSSDTPMLKFFARLGDTRVEFIIHTNQSYLDYYFRHGVSHDEYEVRRIFDSGVAEFLFPRDIYQLDMEKIRQQQMERFRQRDIELPSQPQI